MNTKDIKTFLEIVLLKIKFFFGTRLDETVIPKGYYCYQYDNKNDTVNICPYFKTLSDGGAACKFMAYYGNDDHILGDQCKMCKINKK